MPSVVHSAWQSGGAAALPGTVAEALPSGTQRLCGVLHTAGMWPWMDTQYLERTGGEELEVSCFTLKSPLTNAVPQYQTGDKTC